MRVFRLIIFLLLLSQPIILSAKTDVRFQDGTPEMHSFIKNKIDSSPLFNITDSLHQILINFGYPNSKVAIDTIEGTTIINIKFGDQYFIGNLIIDGDINDTIVYDKHFVQSEYELLIDSILETYKNKGFYFVNLLSQNYKTENNRVNVYLYLQTGPVVEVSSVEFAGIKKTDPKLLKRYLSISSGDTLNMEKIDESLRRLKDVDFITSSKSPEIIPEPGYNKARVRFNLSETKMFKIEGAGGYIPDDNGNFVGYLDFKLQNYFGGGREIGLLIDQKEKNRSVQQLLYSQPLFLLGNGRVEFQLATRDFRELFYEFSINSRYDFEIGKKLKAQFNLGWKNLEPNADIIQAYNVYNAGFGIKMGKIEKGFRRAPQFSVDWDIGYYARFYKEDVADSVSTQVDINDTRNRLRIESTVNLFASTILYLKANFMDVNSSEKPLPISERFLFGGMSGLRGYRNDQFSARRLLIFETEPRFHFSKNNYFYPFADAAYYEYYNLDENSIINKFHDFIWGYGFGFNLNSDNRSFDIIISWGEGDGTDSPFDQPRLNIVLSNSF